MADDKAKKKESEQRAAVAPDDDLRFRYIGFDVYPGKGDKFWKSDAEYDTLLQKVRSMTSVADRERENSIIRLPDISKIDRLVLTLSNAALIACIFFPWLSYHTAQGLQTKLWFGVLGMLGGILGGAWQVSTWAGLASLWGLLVFLLTPVLGVLGLATIFMKAKSEDDYTKRVRLVLRLNYIGFAAWFLAVIFVLPGGSIAPLTQAGLTRLGESFTIVTVFKSISYGILIPIALFYLNAIKSNDL